MAVVELPDGRVIEFPSSMSEADISKALDAEFSAPSGGGAEVPTPAAPSAPAAVAEPAPAPVQQEDPGFLTPERIRGQKLGWQATGAGVANLLGMPVDLATMALNSGSHLAEAGMNAVLPEDYEVDIPTIDPDTAVGGSEWFKQNTGDIAKNLFGYEAATPETRAERVVSNINEYGTEALTGGAAFMRNAPRLGTKAAPLVEEYVTAPVKAFMTDLGGGVGAGAGKSAADEMDVENPLMRALFMLGGAFGGATSTRGAMNAGETATNAAKQAVPDKRIPVDPETGKPPNRATTEMAAQIVQENAVAPSAALDNVDDAIKFYKDGDIPTPTVGQLSKDEGLAALENTYRRSVEGPKLAQRDNQVADAATDMISGTRPANADPNIPAQRFEAEINAARSQAQDVVDQAQKLADDAAAQQAEQAGRMQGMRANRDAASTRLDADIRERQQAIKAEETAAFKAIDPNGEVTVPADYVQSIVNEVRSSVPDGVPASKVLPEEWLQSVENLAKKGDVPLQVLEDMRPELRKAIDRARQTGDGTADALEVLRKGIAGGADVVAKRGDAAGQRATEALDVSRDASKYLRQGEGGKFRNDVQRDNFGTRTRPTKTGARFLTNKEAAADLAALQARTPDPGRMAKDVEDYLVSDMARTLGTAEKINPASMRRWAQLRKDVLDQHPQAKARIEEMITDVVRLKDKGAELTGRLQDALGQQKLTEREINNSAAALVIGKDPAQAASDVLRSKNSRQMVSEIMQKIGKDKEALDGWRAAVTDYLVGTTRSTGGKVTIDALDKAFTKHQHELSQIYTPQEMNALRRAHKALLDDYKVQTTGRSDMETEHLENVLDAIELVGRVSVGHLRAGGIMRSVRLAMAQVPGLDTPVKATQLINRMWFDPEIAKVLLETPVSKKATNIWAKKLRRAMAAQEFGASMGDQEEE